MSLRPIVLKRPLRARASSTSCATSKDAWATSGVENGTTASGIASACPRVISTTNSASPRGANSTVRQQSSKICKTLFIRLELKGELPVEQGWIRWIRQRRGAIHCILDRLTYRGIAVALSHARPDDLTPRYLGHLDAAVYPSARRWGLDPGAGDARLQDRIITRAQGS